MQQVLQTKPVMCQAQPTSILPPHHQTITNCTLGTQLKTKIVRAQAAREQKQRKRNLQKYIPNCCNAIFAVLEDMAAGQDMGHGPKRRRMQDVHDIIQEVQKWWAHVQHTFLNVSGILATPPLPSNV